MSNDYEFLGNSQFAPPMAPRPPTNAHPDLISGLQHTPALKANDDVDLESNRPRGNNDLSFSDGVKPNRSDVSIASTKKSGSGESDEETKSDEKEQKKGKCQTCWFIFAGVTICLAVLCLLGLGAFLLMNGVSMEPESSALNGTNETTTAALETTTSNLLTTLTILPMVTKNTEQPTSTSRVAFNESTKETSRGSTTTSVTPSTIPTVESSTMTTSQNINSSTEAVEKTPGASNEDIRTTLDEKTTTDSTEVASSVTMSKEKTTSFGDVSTTAEEKTTTINVTASDAPTSSTESTEQKLETTVSDETNLTSTKPSNEPGL